MTNKIFLDAAAETANRLSGLAKSRADIGTALRFMGVGVLGVFVVLAIFYGAVKLMMKLFPAKKEP